jgi:hypothetical protein
MESEWKIRRLHLSSFNGHDCLSKGNSVPVPFGLLQTAVKALTKRTWKGKSRNWNKDNPHMASPALTDSTNLRRIGRERKTTESGKSTENLTKTVKPKSSVPTEQFKETEGAERYSGTRALRSAVCMIPERVTVGCTSHIFFSSFDGNVLNKVANRSPPTPLSRGKTHAP